MELKFAAGLTSTYVSNFFDNNEILPFTRGLTPPPTTIFTPFLTHETLIRATLCSITAASRIFYTALVSLRQLRGLVISLLDSFLNKLCLENRKNHEAGGLEPGTTFISCLVP